LRKKIKNSSNVPEPAFEDPGFRALVEENVKVAVHAVAQSKVVKDVSRTIYLLSSTNN
jgi:hypothetical protein